MSLVRGPSRTLASQKARLVERRYQKSNLTTASRKAKVEFSAKPFSNLSEPKARLVERRYTISNLTKALKIK